MTENYKEKNLILEYVPMLPNHLTVDNLLYYVGDDYLTEILCTVLDVSRDSITVVYTKGDIINIKKIQRIDIKKYLRPIPLNINNVENYLNIKFERDNTLDEIQDGIIDDRTDYYDVKSHQIRLTETNTYVNRGDYTGNACMACHLDNFSMDSIGYADLMYIHEFQNFIASVGLDIDLFKCNE